MNSPTAVAVKSAPMWRPHSECQVPDLEKEERHNHIRRQGCDAVHAPNMSTECNPQSRKTLGLQNNQVDDMCPGDIQGGNVPMDVDSRTLMPKWRQ